ncbi:hypothetical protein [Streptomyces sp. wa13]|uniref:hypothetical protein n=1 Tax=Streptomyces sp. wa13 TaxID=1828236 RepID=UPI003C7B099E
MSTDYLTHALTSGLPTQVDSPVGFVRRRLRDKVPPRLPATPAPAAPDAPARRLLVECTDCGRPGPSETLPDGLCRPCRRVRECHRAYFGDHGTGRGRLPLLICRSSGATCAP